MPRRRDKKAEWKLKVVEKNNDVGGVFGEATREFQNM